MLNFFKKQLKRDSSMAQLSEEDIQKKLYGTYKPGTLGRVIKVGEEPVVEASPASQDDELEPDLFSDMNTLSASNDAKTAPVIDDASEEIITEQEDVASKPQQGAKVSKGKDEAVQPIVDDDDLLQIDFGKEEDTLFLKPSDKFASVKVTLEEMWDKLRGLGPKFFIISGGILIGVILGFNMISSYVQHEKDDKVVVVNEKRSMPSQPERASVPKPVPTVSPFGTREVMTQSVTLPTVKVSSTTTKKNEVIPKAVAAAEGYTVQICVSNNAEATKTLVSDLQDAGFDAFSSRQITKLGKELFLIYVGRFSKQEDATAAMKHYRTVPQLKRYSDSFVTKIKE